jgi:hypothetical protein
MVVGIEIGLQGFGKIPGRNPLKIKRRNQGIDIGSPAHALGTDTVLIEQILPRRAAQRQVFRNFTFFKVFTEESLGWLGFSGTKEPPI